MSRPRYASLDALLTEVRACRACAPHLPLGPRPIVRVGADARILIVGQAPGIRVHETGIPWNDASGDRLRQWLGVDAATFLDESQFAIIPMGFCYPGRGKSGDNPPRRECAPLWLDRLLAELPNGTKLPPCSPRLRLPNRSAPHFVAVRILPPQFRGQG